MHKIINKHLKKLGYANGKFPDGNLEKFLDYIDMMCKEADEDRIFLEHTLETTSQEMSELYEELKQKSQTALAKSEARYKELAKKDMLVGILNRRGFHDELKRTISLNKRNSQNFAVLFLDLDHFKEVNDTYGHEIGDKLLKEVTNRVLSNIRIEDIFARIGGDEFVILFTNINLESIRNLVSKTLSLFQNRWIIDGHELNITTSIGVSIYPLDAEDGHELLISADKAMYRSKELGRNKTVFFEDLGKLK
jgi:diguanylate cyclase (GGDEF)-like protein